jgi:hypothetical protein
MFRFVYKLKRWQWMLVGGLMLIYFLLATFQVYGGFYIGYPPYTPAFLNATRRPLERRFELSKASSLRVYGGLREGRVTMKLDGVQVRQFVGNFDARFTLLPGTRTLKLEMTEATGNLNYSLE